MEPSPATKGEITGTGKGDPTATDDRRDDATLQPDIGERTALHLVQDQIDEAKRLLEEAHLEVNAAQTKVTEAACRVGEVMEEMAKIESLAKANLESADR